MEKQIIKTTIKPVSPRLAATIDRICAKLEAIDFSTWDGAAFKERCRKYRAAMDAADREEAQA